MTFRDIMLGRNVYIPSRADYKNALLRSQLATATLIVGVSYIFIDHFHGIYGNEPFYIGGIFASLLTLVLNRLQYYKTSTYFFLFFINLLIFYFSAIDPVGTGVPMFFSSASLIAVALLGYHNLKQALLFVSLSIALFLISYWVEIEFIPKRTYSEDYIRVNYTTNFLIALISSIGIMYFLMNVNHYSEREILRKNDALAKANDELDRFVYSASHDLKAPLSSLLGLIEIAKLDQKDILKYLDMMKIRIHDMEAFIREIIAYSRNVRTQVVRQKSNLKKTISEVTEGLMFADAAQKVILENKIATDIEIVTDVTRFKVVMSNLIANSLKYYDDRKATCYVVVDAERIENATRIFIKDNGIGIDVKHLDKIFNMFYRASEKSKGSGLGLYIVKETLSKINGAIKVESTLGEGSLFTVTIYDE